MTWISRSDVDHSCHATGPTCLSFPALARWDVGPYLYKASGGEGGGEWGPYIVGTKNGPCCCCQPPVLLLLLPKPSSIIHHVKTAPAINEADLVPKRPKIYACG